MENEKELPGIVKVILWIVLFPVLAIALIWRTNWYKAVKILLTVVVLILFIFVTAYAVSRKPSTKTRILPTVTPTPELLIKFVPSSTPTPIGADYRITLTALAVERMQAVPTSTEVPYHNPQNLILPQSTCNIKGNVNSNGEKFYHCPNYPTYGRTNVRTNEGDRWFCSEAEAIQAGFVSGSKGYGCIQ